jgi:hypothetical protein
MELKVITLEEEAFWQLFNKMVDEVKKQYGEQALSRWVDTAEAMDILKIKSKTTLQELRDSGQIRFSQPMKKHILYDRESILAYIDRHAREPF